MEDVERLIENLRKRRSVREEKLKTCELEQVAGYNELMKEIQDLENERNRCKANIAKNLNVLTTHKHSIYKIIKDSENVPGLPITHTYQQQAVSFFSEVIQFVNKLPQIYDDINNTDKEKVDPMRIVEDITASTNSMANQLQKTKSSISQTETLMKNIKLLQESCCTTDDEDFELDRSIFDCSL
ncbi:hypothetical protein KM043_008661 [Ampulex compressa]|nr:hypothetical protein KM043_008661 [Ampulex compressa]